MEFVEFLNRYGEESTNKIIDVLTSSKKQASGRLRESLRYELSLDVQNLDFEITFSGIDYERFIRSGRRAGNGVKRPPYNAIAEWASHKGIPEQYVPAIQKGIAESGIKPFDFVDYVFTEQNIDSLSESITKLLQEQITDKIITSIQ
jgi:hypothetical protein